MHVLFAFYILEERQVKVEFTACGYDYFEWRLRLAQKFPQLLVVVAEFRFRWERQCMAPLCLVESVQWLERVGVHRWTPQMVKNSARRSGLVSYAPRQKVVHVSGAIARTPRISVQRW